MFARLPLRFEAIVSKPGDASKWVAHGPGFGVGLNQDGAVVQFADRALRLTFEGGSRGARFEGLDKSAVASNYFGRNFRSTDAFGRLRQKGVYPGIDVVYYGKGQRLEYDFELAPGADPSRIRMRFEGADSVRLGLKGEVTLALGDREVIQNPPVVYQRVFQGSESGEIVGVPSSYVSEADGSIGIALGAYDRTRPLVVDPAVLFSIYLAGTSSDVPVGIGHDQNGLIYIAGYTYSPDFPLVGAAFSPNFLNTNQEAFTSVLNPLATDGNVITYSGYFTGDFGDYLTTMNVDNQGVFYLAGYTDDTLFPMTGNAYSSTNGGTRKMFISSLDTKQAGAAGLTYSTYFGGTGTDLPSGIAAAGGKIYITGSTNSADYPVTANAFQATRPGGTFDGFVAEFDPSQSGTAGLVASTYLGAESLDVPRSIAIAPDGQVWVAGYTRSGGFPTTPNSLRPFYSGGGDAFVTRINLASMTLTYSTLLGGSAEDQATKIVLEPSGRVAVAGYTLSLDFPVTSNALQSTQAGNGDVFLAILDPNVQDFTKSLVYSTYLGGSDADVAYDLRRDAAGKYYLCGYTLSLDFPVRNALATVSVPGNSTDAFAAVIDPAAAPLKALVYASYITGPGYQIAYGIDVDTAGNVYVTGAALGDVFSVTGPNVPPDTEVNVFLLKFSLSSQVAPNAVEHAVEQRGSGAARR